MDIVPIELVERFVEFRIRLMQSMRHHVNVIGSARVIGKVNAP
jgi:hypothetical protein